jgi:hypothetical protein
VSVVGEAANVVNRYGDNPYTTFDLLDANDRTLPVFTWGIPAVCRQGDTCRVVGTFVGEKSLGAYPGALRVEAEKIEKVSGVEYETAGVLFRRRNTVTGNLGLRGGGPQQLYIPQ